MNYVTFVDSPIGRLSLHSDGRALTGLYMEKRAPADEPVCGGNIPVLKAAGQQLQEYFAGARREFDLATALHGTDFQCRVWQELKGIPCGETLSYGELAQRIRQPNAARAVGLANGANPVSIIIPCHRIIGADGSLTGYGGGLKRKQWLLEHERRMTRADLADIAARA